MEDLKYYLINLKHPYRVKKLKNLTAEKREEILEYFRTHRICKYCGGIYESVKRTGLHSCDNPECKEKCQNHKMEVKEKRENNNLEKYGTKYYLNEDARKAARDRQTSEDRRNRVIKARETRIKRYGSASYNNEEKSKETKIRKYGSMENFTRMKSAKMKEIAKNWDFDTINAKRADTMKKITDENPNYYKEKTTKGKNTKLEKYGDENYNNIEKHRQTIKEKYNVDNVSQIPGVQDKVKQTNLEKYGETHAMKTEKFKDKAKETSLKIYGTEYAAQSREIKDKTIQTNIERYGTPYAQQRHLKNLDDLNANFITKNFIHNGVLEYPAALEYFGYKSSASPIISILQEAGIQFTIKRQYCLLENKFLDDFSYYTQVDILRQGVLEPLTYKADGLILNADFRFREWEFGVDDKIAVEFLGDYWHGYKNNEELTHFGETFSSLYRKTFKRFDKVKACGYTILYVWESDYLENGLAGVKKY